MFVTMVFHHPRPEYEDDFADFMGDIVVGMRGTDGLLSLESYRNPAAGTLVAIGRWQSAADAQAGIPKLMSIGGRDPKWTDQPDDVFQLVEVEDRRQHHD